jgi:hypothetical protein
MLLPWPRLNRVWEGDERVWEGDEAGVVVSSELNVANNSPV